MGKGHQRCRVRSAYPALLPGTQARAYRPAVGRVAKHTCVCPATPPASSPPRKSAQLAMHPPSLERMTADPVVEERHEPIQELVPVHAEERHELIQELAREVRVVKEEEGPGISSSEVGPSRHGSITSLG